MLKHILLKSPIWHNKRKMVKEKILIVEDEEDILELIRYNLQKNGYELTSAGSGEEALNKLASETPTLIILDLMLPGIDGLEVCRTIRGNKQTKDIAILMLTAKSEEADIVTGLELGADDYMTKPFSPRVLLARIRAILRRKSDPPVQKDSPVNLTGLSIHPGRHEVKVEDKPVTLSATEFKILHFLATHPGWVFTRDQIINTVHGEAYPVTDRSVDVQIVGLRKKLGSAGSYIETIRGIGYRFKEQ